MEFRNRQLTVSEAKKTDNIYFLSGLGYKRAKIKANGYWYLSPPRTENTSCRVNRKQSQWYDHQVGKGGSFVDFAVLYYKHTVRKLLERLNTGFCFQQPFLPASKYYGIGFRNAFGGFEIHNPYFKISSSSTGITAIDNGPSPVCVPETITGFLSFKINHQNEPEVCFDFMILRPISFLEKARGFIKKHTARRLYIDRNNTGQNCSHYVLRIIRRFKEESKLYERHKDLKDPPMNFGRPELKLYKTEAEVTFYDSREFDVFADTGKH